jgi:hypothetical protein
MINAVFALFGWDACECVFDGSVRVLATFHAFSQKRRKLLLRSSWKYLTGMIL